MFCKNGVLIKYKVSGNFIKKETLAQVFFCIFYEISKNTFFYITPLAASVVRRNTKHKKNENTRIERNLKKKVKKKFLEYFSFAMSDCYDFYEKYLWKVFRNNVITFGWQLFACFYQISNKFYCLIFLIRLFSWTIISRGS